MENSDKAKIIIDILKRQLEYGSFDHIHAETDLASSKMGNELWEKAEHSRGYLGYSRSPYKVEFAQKKVDRTLKEKLARQEVLDYAIDVFLDKI